MLRQMKVTIMGQDVDNFSEGEKRINIIRMELHTEPLAWWSRVILCHFCSGSNLITEYGKSWTCIWSESEHLTEVGVQRQGGQQLVPSDASPLTRGWPHPFIQCVESASAPRCNCSFLPLEDSFTRSIRDPRDSKPYLSLEWGSQALSLCLVMNFSDPTNVAEDWEALRQFETDIWFCY